MADMVLTIQHGSQIFIPPVISPVKVERERLSAPGKLTFTTIKTNGQDMSFTEGDAVCFYYDNKPVFMGYVFTKKRNREHHIDVTCYDQIRYLKNKYSWYFKNNTANQIIAAMCTDFGLNIGTLANTNYAIPRIREENKSALDVAMSVLDETLTNTGYMYTLYDNFGSIQLTDCADMISSTLITNDTAENFDYTSSIDEETYNSIMLYYKEDDSPPKIYTAESTENIDQWGTLRYFEEVKNKTIAQNKADTLLELYNRKSRELKVSGAFGDISVRGGSLIPVLLDLGDIKVNNLMLVQNVTHTFEPDYYTMDLTLDGAWN